MLRSSVGPTGALAGSSVLLLASDNTLHKWRWRVADIVASPLLMVCASGWKRRLIIGDLRA